MESFALILVFIIRLQQLGNGLLLSLKMTFFVGSLAEIFYNSSYTHMTSWTRHLPVITPVVIVFQVVKERTKSAILDFTTGRILETRLAGNVSFVFKMNPAYWICYFNLSLRWLFAIHDQNFCLPSQINFTLVILQTFGSLEDIEPANLFYSMYLREENLKSRPPTVSKNRVSSG